MFVGDGSEREIDCRFVVVVDSIIVFVTDIRRRARTKDEEEMMRGSAKPVHDMVIPPGRVITQKRLTAGPRTYSAHLHHPFLINV